MQTSGYFQLDRQASSEAEVEDLLAKGRVQFAVTIPENFGRKLVRGERPVLLVEADASAPAAVGNAVAALNQVAASPSSDPRRTRADLNAVAAPVGVREPRP